MAAMKPLQNSLFEVIGALFLLMRDVPAAERTYSRNATSCDQCHSVPAKFGSSRVKVERTGMPYGGKFVPSSEGGIHHRISGAAIGNAAGLWDYLSALGRFGMTSSNRRAGC
jgi:hypothetical protein